MIKTSKIYVDIHTLLDLRQGVLYGMYETHEALAEYLLSEEYCMRAVDQFPDVSNEELKEQLVDPSLDILEASMATHMFNVIKSKIANLVKRNQHYNETSEPEIVVNAYPFLLTEKEVNHIRDLIFIKLDKKAFITVICVPDKDLTPYFFKSIEAVSAFIYDFKSWVENHLESLNKQRLPECLFYFPAVGNKPLTEEEKKLYTKLGFKDIYEYTEFILSSVVTVSFLPILFYSSEMIAAAHLEKLNAHVLKEESEKAASTSDVDLSKVDLSALYGK
jgi:uncharacterized protein YuzB (UPF0349 family)